ncbi:MAG: hypothetical protein MUQ10_20635 [Anaerolineae bacterium]|nr:hypothetical protein [Anaerolineae bacterium]
MSFRCPECSAQSLAITRSFELPADSRSDEITLQIVKCSSCGFAGIAVYEESRRGALDSESFSHTSYRVIAADLRRLKHMIGRCPRPRDSRCGCAAHQSLGRRDASGRWNGLQAVACEGASELRR